MLRIQIKKRQMGGWVRKDTQSCVLVYTCRYISVYTYTHKKL